MNQKIFLQTQDGGCRMFTSDPMGRLPEFPFTTNLTIDCQSDGPHPHHLSNGTQLLAIKRDMSDPAEIPTHRAEAALVNHRL